ncbi:acetyl-CoA carboxylase biotin carboxyl carrier protein [Lactiplantibacillus pentosus]|jgi:acetyl-CoA carboxylase biotin carboxyl carrier protein|uniref:Acetyl-CoA carboxylase, biotin carboxyl carrier protein n=1 Tax=Lactiplantibacillus pentosus IG1 TaxID=1042160 RepID=G0M348_LACPE|nr:biotin/lipoyl-containing protein [Lactiplantibacillus pentosus]CCC16519.1 acetyl-CoA carboxylase, biotin carboxyl carrier protein [Lactiplantibacillus pentosus IG1]MCT3283500.1 acetyl-CoA carboxylase biotin carboxyl carrier protein subunit [Lactiplantibacillus pentosus]MCT3302926.1 acetyl-CoA carboxylase biotin carboxyl carrier protein subunit [Lactiplantibacillus pentosus]PRO80352.1 acetyl-CoA carboxylase biotin carboxyl carrier protein subunit [Lactiplantibacillus pentosus]PRO81765.1 acet
MELKDLDRLVEKYARQGYQQIRVKAGDLEIAVTKPSVTAPVNAAASTNTVTNPSADDQAAAITNESATTESAIGATDTANVTIPSPMVGVVHLAPDLQVGQSVTAGQELGQIESMKLFNPLVSPADGTLTAVLIADNATVEYEQPLFTMRKDR